MATAAVATQTRLLPVTITSQSASRPDAPSGNEGRIDIQFPRASISVRGQVDLDALQTVLATLHQR